MTMAGDKTSSSPPEWSVDGLVREFVRVHDTMQDRSFCFLLGAGASVTSGIPGGGKLAREWVEDLYIQRQGTASQISIEEWAASGELGIEGFS